MDIDPIYHTETMLKILREQGHSQHAMELAELILREKPEHEGVRVILGELKEDARRAFERFKSGGRPQETAPDESEEIPSAEVSPGTIEQDVAPEPSEGFEFLEEAPHLSIVANVSVDQAEIPTEIFEEAQVETVLLESPRQKKIQFLQNLLRRIGRSRQSHERIES